MQQAAATEQQEPQRRKPRGRPWPPGVSGNPRGRRGARFATLFADLAAELGPLTAIERQQLAQAVRLMIRLDREKDAQTAVKLQNAIDRALRPFRKRGAPAPDKPAPWSPLRSRLMQEPATPAGEAAK